MFNVLNLHSWGGRHSYHTVWIWQPVTASPWCMSINRFSAVDSLNIDCVYMACNNPTIDLILNKTIFRLRCLHELLIEYSIHIPIYMLQSIVWLMAQGTHAHPTSYVQRFCGFDLKPEVKQQHNSRKMLLPFHLLSFFSLILQKLWY